MKIAIIGTHGTGKTTLAYVIATAAKQKGVNVKLVQEVARTSPFPLNEDFDIDCAHWIITSQIKRELSAKAEKSEMIICDRSSIDPICYLKAVDKPTPKYEALEDFADEWMKTYDKIIFVYPTGEKLDFDGVRCMDDEYQLEVHDNFLEYIERSKMAVTLFPASKIFENDIKPLLDIIFTC